MSIRVWALASVATALLASGPAAGDGDAPAATIPWAQLSAGYQPAPDSDEGGLWMIGSKGEDAVRSSPLLIKDAALNAYLRKIICRLSGPYCASIRIYVLDVPYFNAAMAPNGMLAIWAGTLLRAQNEAELSFVLGHEISHYLLRHTLARYRRIRDRSGALAVFQIVTAGAGVGLVGSLAILAGVSSIAAYSRDEEREADAHGFELATAADYDPAQAAKLWQQELDEENALPKHDGTFDIFTANHPPTAERLETIRDMVAAVQVQRANWDLGANEHQKAVQPFRKEWMTANLGLAHFNQSLIVLNALLAAEPQSGELQYFIGELYRRRNDDGDSAKALAAYNAAIAAGGMPNEVYRGLGLTALKAGDKPAARTALQKYLALVPAADDRGMIEYYLSQL